MRHSRRTAASALLSAFVIALGLLVGAPAPASAAPVPNPFPDLISRWEPCDPNTGVTVVVDFLPHNEGRIEVGCALGHQDSGYAALHNAGFTTADAPGISGFISRINGFPAAGQPGSGAPDGGAYWSYWKANVVGQAWGYSGLGAGSGDNKPRIGAVEGWAFGSSDGSTGHPRVPAMDGAGIPPDFVRIPQPSSTEAIAAAVAWLDRVEENLTGTEQESVPAVWALVDALEARLAIGTPAGSLTSTLARLRPRLAELSAPPGRVDGRRAAQVLRLLVRFDDPVDAALRNSLGLSLLQMVYLSGPHAGLFAAELVDGLRSGVGGDQSIYHDALLASIGEVPAATVDGVLGSQSTDGAFAGSTAITGRTLATLARIRAAGPAAVGDGTVAAATLDEAIRRAADHLVARQLAHGGWRPTTTSGDGPAFGAIASDTTDATVWAVLGLQAAGRPEPARAGARYLARQQYTPATGMPASWQGAVATGGQDFEDRRLDRYDFGYGIGAIDPTSIDVDDGRFRSFVGDYLPSTPSALRAWAAVPFADAGVVTTSVTGLTATTATVLVTLRPSSEPQDVWVTHGRSGRPMTSTPPVTIPASATPTTHEVVLTGLTPETAYDATPAGGVPALGTSFSGAVTTFTTPRPMDAVTPALLAAPAHLTFGTPGTISVTGSHGASGPISTTVAGAKLTATLADGVGRLPIPARSLPPGTRALAIWYAGLPGRFAASGTTATVHVRKARPAVRIAGPKRLRRGGVARYTVAVTAPGVTPTGKVTLKVAGTARTVRLDTRGRATVKARIASGTRLGRTTATLTYRGSAYVDSRRASARSKVVR
jgi:hypothetical protein